MIDPAITRYISQAQAQPPLKIWPWPKPYAPLSAARSRDSRAPFLFSPPGSGRALRRGGRATTWNQCIEVDTSAVPDDEWAEVFCRIQRYAILGRFGVI